MAVATPHSNLQTLNLALATGFVVACGDAIQAISDSWGPAKGGAGWTHVGLLFLLLSIGAKVAFDDHVALKRGKIRPFQAIDSTALVITYSIIISSAALIVDFYLSVLLLACYVLALGLWNLIVFLILCYGAKPARGIRDFLRASGRERVKAWFRCLRADERGNRRVIRWLILDLFFGGLLLVFALGEAAPAAVLVGVAAFLIVDLVLSESFGK